MDDCFGDVQKLPTKCSDAARSLVNRFAPASGTHILITESANLVSKYDLEDLRTSVDSWSFNELNKLLIPMVVYFPPNGVKNALQETLIGLHSGNTIIEWVPTDSRELVAARRRKFKNPIAAIVSFSKKKHPYQPIVIFSNGYAEHFEDIKGDWDESAVEPVLGPNEELVTIKHDAMGKFDAVLYYISQNKLTSQKTVYKLTIFNNRAPTQTIKCPLNIDIDCCTISKIHGFIGSLKKEDKIHFYSLEPSSAGSGLIAQTPLFTFDAEAFDKVFAIASFRKGAIVVLTELAEIGDTLFQVQVYETKYGTKIGELNFSETVYANDLTVVNESVLVTTKSNIVLAPVIKQTVRLSELMHKSINEEEKAADFSDKFKALIGVGEQEQIRSVDQLVKINKMFAGMVTTNKGPLRRPPTEPLPEELIVSLFNFCTRNYLEVQADPSENQVTGGRGHLLRQYEILFGNLSKLPHNEAFLVSCLKRSSITMAQHLLAIDWLLAAMPHTDLSPISWISSLLDANFRQFVIKPSDEVKVALRRIAEQVSRSIHFYEGLGPAKTLFEAISSSDKTVGSLLSPSETNIGVYSIELLSFT